VRIAVMGSAPSSVRLGPYMDNTYAAFQQGKVQAYPAAPHLNETWDIWGCSPGLFGVAPRATRWFELHRWEPGQPWFSPEYCQFLRTFKGPVYTGGPVEDVPSHIVYPLLEVEAEFSSFFLTSSLALMMAKGILEIEQTRRARAVYRELSAAGAPNAQEYAAKMLPKFVDPVELQKPDSDDVIGLPGCWFFGFEIVRRGIGLYYPPESDLFCPEPVYGVCEWDHAYIKATSRAREINARMEANQQELGKLQNQALADHGARDDLNYQIKTWLNPWRLPAGVVIHQDPGSGLGVNVRSIDGKPTGAVTPASAVDMGAVEYTGRVAAVEPAPAAPSALKRKPPRAKRRR
jgi:hypothetical protein